MPDDVTPPPFGRRSRPNPLSVEERVAVLEAGQLRIDGTLVQLVAQREREHRENQSALHDITRVVRSIDEGFKKIAMRQDGADVRIDSLEETREQQRGALRFIQVFVSLSVVVPVLLAIAHVLTMGHL